MVSGEILEIIADDIGAKEDVPALLKKTDCFLEEFKEEGEKLTFLVKKN
jgi:tRNA 2-thiouridine synthesizing protein A